MSLLNWGGGLSAAGTAISGFAQSAGLEQQKADLEQQQTMLANQLKEGSDTRLTVLQGDQARQTAQTTAEAQGTEARSTAGFVNTLPMTETEKATTAAAKEHADAAMLEAQKPVSGGFNSSWLVPDKTSPTGWTPITATGGDSAPTKVDATSNNLSAQTGLSSGAIAVMTGQTKGMRLGQAQTAKIQNEINAWGVANGINTSTMLPQVEGAFKVITQNITRNNQGKVLENEIDGSIKNAAELADKVDLGRVNMSNVAAVWAGKQVNDPDAVQVADQLGRLREELAGYNAVAGGHLNDNGTPAIGPNDIHAAEAIITNGINSGGLTALSESIHKSADKNKVVLRQAVDDANADFYRLFGATYHAQPAESGAESPAAPAAPNPATTPTAPSPAGSKAVPKPGAYTWTPNGLVPQ